MKPRPIGTLKAAVTRLFDSLGSLARVADVIRRGVSQTARYADPDQRDHHLNVEQLRALIHAGGSRDVLEFLAAEAGCVLLVIDAPVGEFGVQMALTGEKTALLFREYAGALTDAKSPGRIDRDEARRILDVADRLMIDLGGLTTALRRRRDGEE